jgi:C4-dicarboxylate-specific signal transduction histidine kinase
MSHIPRSLPLQLVLVIPFVAQMTAAVVVVGYLSWRSGQEAVNDVAAQLRQEVSARVEQNLHNYLAIPHQINQVNADAIAAGWLDWDFSQNWQSHLLRQVKNFNQVGGIGAGNEQGEFINVGRNDQNQLVVNRALRSEQFSYNQYSLRSDGTIDQLLKSTPNFNARLRPPYKKAVQMGEPTWSEVFPHVTDPMLVMTAAHPLYQSDGKLLGVVQTRLHLSWLGEFLRSLNVGKQGKIFVMDTQGTMIATSAPELPFIRQGKEVKTIPATASQDHLTQATAQLIQTKHPNLGLLLKSQQLEFDLDGQRQFVQVSPFNDPKGLRWLMVVVVPESEFMGQIESNRRSTLLWCIGTLVLAAGCAFWTSKWIVAPILRLQSASKAMADRQFDKKLPHSGIQELDALSRSFSQMATQLQQSFRDLDQAKRNLEQQIQARTEALQDSNDQLIMEVAERVHIEMELEEQKAELVDAMAKLQKTQAQLIQSEKMSALGQLVAGVAHEINNPVNFIHGNLAYVEQYVTELLQVVNYYQTEYPQPSAMLKQYIEQIDLNFIDRDLHAILQSIAVGTDRIREIVLSLRNFSRLDEAAYKFVDLHEGIDSTLMILQHRLKGTADHPEIQVVRHYGDLPLVECYSGELNQVFMHLLNNAIDAIEETRHQTQLSLGVITITTQQPDDQSVLVRIQDNGLGISEAVRDSMFNPFFTTKPIGQGTGLGLAISYQIITDRHQGQLCCDPVAEGASFVIKIPLQASPPS